MEIVELLWNMQVENEKFLNIVLHDAKNMPRVMLFD